jgi:hypothetical protein
MEVATSGADPGFLVEGRVASVIGGILEEV